MVMRMASLIPGSVSVITAHRDGSILIVGDFSAVNNVPAGALLREFSFLGRTPAPARNLESW